MQELSYPFDVNYILKNKRKIKKELLKKQDFINIRIAILGGSTTNEIKNILELFLLNYGILPTFYESDYNKYYEDAIFDNILLDEFKPNIIYIHTTNKNILNYPNILNNKEEIDNMLTSEFNKYKSIWDSLFKKYNSIIIQNNFENINYRILGNSEVTDIHGRINYINRLNELFYEYKNNNKNFYINDINYISSCYGLDKWFNSKYWYMYKYAMDYEAIPYLSFNLANIIKSLYGKNKKAIAVDLDNTLWGGIVGEDGVNNLKIGIDSKEGEVFLDFQKYLKEIKNLGILLNINSKNDLNNAIDGLNHPDNILKLDDFIINKSNWNSKNKNIEEIAESLNIGSDSFVFLDDNPSERKIVKDYIDGIAVPDMNDYLEYIKILDKNAYFEITNITKEDLDKNNYYKENVKRNDFISKFDNYEDYLKSLKMKAEINSFKPIYLERITELINKSNQFNLTTKRYNLSEIKDISNDNNYIKLYGKLYDIFGDNGVISIVIGKIINDELHIDLWLMSCRVLKRNMEYAMMDKLISILKSKNINTIYGYYYPTKKNNMVSEFYDQFGFILIENNNGNKTYKLDIKKYKNKNNIIEVNYE